MKYDNTIALYYNLACHRDFFFESVQRCEPPLIILLSSLHNIESQSFQTVPTAETSPSHCTHSEQHTAYAFVGKKLRYFPSHTSILKILLIDK